MPARGLDRAACRPARRVNADPPDIPELGAGWPLGLFTGSVASGTPSCATATVCLITEISKAGVSPVEVLTGDDRPGRRVGLDRDGLGPKPSVSSWLPVWPCRAC
jgi:hypothetical protein